MKSQKMPVPTAKEINDAHKLARSSAETAVQHALRCGQLLARKKEELDRGDFDSWIEKHCDFGRRMAYNYIKASKSCNALHDSSAAAATPAAFSSLRGLLGIEAKPQKKSEKRDTSTRSVKGAVMNPPESAARGSETGNRNKPVGVEAGQVRPPVPVPEPVTSEDWKPEVPDDEELAAIDREIQESQAKVLSADDVTIGYHKELKRQAAEIATLKITRDGYMNGKAAVTKMLEAEQRRVVKLEKELAKLREENERLRERVSIMEAA